MRIVISTESYYPVSRKEIRKAVKEVLLENSLIGEEVELEINFVGDRKMTQLNKKYMGRKGTTDVLSFPLTKNSTKKREEGDLETDFVNPSDEVLRLGGIVVSYPEARRQAMTDNMLVDEKINQLVKHGLLHLLGIHHE